jgi:hypothetical protein
MKDLLYIVAGSAVWAGGITLGLWLGGLTMAFSLQVALLLTLIFVTIGFIGKHGSQALADWAKGRALRKDEERRDRLLQQTIGMSDKKK